MYILIVDTVKPGINIFRDKKDKERFAQLLSVVNNNIPLASKWWKLEKVKTEPLNIVNIISHKISKNNIKLLIQTEEMKYKTRFILRLKTAYTMYYNKKYKHKGGIFASKNESELVSEDELEEVIKSIE